MIALLQDDGLAIGEGIAAGAGIIGIVIFILIVMYGILAFLLPIFIFLIYRHVRQINKTTRALQTLLARQQSHDGYGKIEKTARQPQPAATAPATTKPPPDDSAMPRRRNKKTRAKPGQSYAEAVISAWQPPEHLEIGQDVYDLIEQCRRDNYTIDQTVEHLKDLCQVEDYDEG